MVHGRVEDRDFDPVEPGGLDVLHDREVLLGDVPGPEEEVHARLHARLREWWERVPIFSGGRAVRQVGGRVAPVGGIG
jgi:hypothetical protein